MTGCPNSGRSSNAYSSAPVTPQSKTWPHQQVTAFWLPACTAEEGWLVDCPTLSGSIGAEEIPSPKGFPQKLWLLGSKNGRNDCPGCGSSELHSSIGNALRSTMWSNAGAPPMSCPLLEGDGLLNVEMLDVAVKDPVAPAPASPYSRALRGGTDPTDT